jgi:hypothetical protein
LLLHPCHSYGLSIDYATLPSRVLFELWRITYCWIGNVGYFATKHCSGKWTGPDGRNRLKVGGGRYIEDYRNGLLFNILLFVYLSTMFIFRSQLKFLFLHQDRKGNKYLLRSAMWFPAKHLITLSQVIVQEARHIRIHSEDM